MGPSGQRDENDGGNGEEQIDEAGQAVGHPEAADKVLHHVQDQERYRPGPQPLIEETNQHETRDDGGDAHIDGPHSRRRSGIDRHAQQHPDEKPGRRRAG